LCVRARSGEGLEVRGSKAAWEFFPPQWRAAAQRSERTAARPLDLTIHLTKPLRGKFRRGFVPKFTFAFLGFDFRRQNPVLFSI